MANLEPDNNESRNRKIKNALVSGTFKPGSTEDLKLISKRQCRHVIVFCLATEQQN